MKEEGTREPVHWDAQSLRRLFRRLQSTDIDELEVEQDGLRLHVLRDPTFVPGTVAPEVLQVEQDAAAGIPVLAPLSGVFYSRPSPEQPAFVNIGDWVAAGQVVALIETMKLFNEVLAETGGRMAAMLAQDGDLVENGTPLFRLEPGEPDLVIEAPPTA